VADSPLPIGSTNDTLALTAANPHLKGTGIIVYFKQYAAIEWSWIGYMESKRYGDEDGKGKQIRYFANFVTSLEIIRQNNESVAEHAKALLKKFMDPAPRSVEAMNYALAHPLEELILPRATVAVSSHSRGMNAQLRSTVKKKVSWLMVILSRTITRVSSHKGA